MVLTVFAQEQPVYIGLKVDDTFKVGHYRYCSGFGVRVVDMRVETQPILHELFTDRSSLPPQRVTSTSSLWTA